MRRVIVTIIILMISIPSISFATSSPNSYSFYFIAYRNGERYLLCYSTLTGEYTYEYLERPMYITNNSQEENGFYMVEGNKHYIPDHAEYGFLNDNITAVQEPFTIYFYTNNSFLTVKDNVSPSNFRVVLAYIDGAMVYYSTDFSIIADNGDEKHEYIPIKYNTSFCYLANPKEQLWIINNDVDINPYYKNALSYSEFDAPFFVITNGNVINEIISPPFSYDDFMLNDLQLSRDSTQIYVLATIYEQSTQYTVLFMYDLSSDEWFHIIDMPESYIGKSMYITKDEQWMITSSYINPFADDDEKILLTSLESGESINLLDGFENAYPEMDELMLYEASEFGVICVN